MQPQIKRRQFISTTLAAGAGLYLAANKAGAQAPAPKGEVINVGLIGAGAQGNLLINSSLTIPNIKFAAVCDIWGYRNDPVQTYLGNYGHKVRTYEDYRDMLEEEKDLHAVIIATPDWVHAGQVNACLNAGIHVYCEGMMSNSLEGAQSMIKTMRQTGKLLQIGYQRRSNPRYIHAVEKVLKQAKLTGQLTHASGHWARPVTEDNGWPRRFALEEAALQKMGYPSMHEFRNWQHYKKYSAGPLGFYGAQQLDVLLWFLGTTPKSVLASGGVDFYKNHQCCDNATAIYEFPINGGTLRASYQLLTTTSGSIGNVEIFMGTEGSLRLSEQPRWTKVLHEPHAPKWDKWQLEGLITKAEFPGTPKKPQPEGAEQKPEDPGEVKARETGEVVPFDIPVVLDKPVHQPHLENFFEAIRGKAKLNCPADVAYPTEVVVLKTLAAVEARRALEFTEADFKVS